MLIVSKETNPVVRARAAKLRGRGAARGRRKGRGGPRLAGRQGIPAERAGYLGNDINDLGPMALVGWPVAVADAHPAVRRAARLVLTRAGGHGAVRELCELVLRHGAQQARSALKSGATAPGGNRSRTPPTRSSPSASR